MITENHITEKVVYFTDDDENDELSCLFDWGDGYESWTEDVSPGDEASRTHEYQSPGEYHIKARARDNDGALSDWSNHSTINIFFTPPSIVTGLYIDPAYLTTTDDLIPQYIPKDADVTIQWYQNNSK
ncbi:TPA: PKD domain-containing protein [Candidatus Poribacteria bacterium]|nr:PKD domain-containing protein [Candidatus Poribacteria bacterium]